MTPISVKHQVLGKIDIVLLIESVIGHWSLVI